MFVFCGWNEKSDGRSRRSDRDNGTSMNHNPRLLTLSLRQAPVLLLLSFSFLSCLVALSSISIILLFSSLFPFVFFLFFLHQRYTASTFLLQQHTTKFPITQSMAEGNHPSTNPIVLHEMGQTSNTYPPPPSNLTIPEGSQVGPYTNSATLPVDQTSPGYSVRYCPMTSSHSGRQGEPRTSSHRGGQQTGSHQGGPLKSRPRGVSQASSATSAVAQAPGGNHYYSALALYQAAVSQGPMVPGSPQEVLQTSGTGAMFESHGPGVNHYYSALTHNPAVSQGLMIPGSPQEVLQTSGTGAMFGSQVPGGNHYYSAPTHTPAVLQGPMVPGSPQEAFQTSGTGAMFFESHVPGGNDYYSAPTHTPAVLQGPMIPGSPQEAFQTNGTGAMFFESHVPGGNDYYSASTHTPAVLQGPMIPSSPQEAFQTSGTGALFVDRQPLATSPSPVTPRVHLWTGRSDADKAAKKPLSDVEKYIIKCLRGDESKPSMSHDGINKITGFPKVTINRVRSELKDQQLPQMTLSYNEEDEPILFTLTVFG